MQLPPCHKPGTFPNACAQRVYTQQIEHLYRLSGPWTAWRVQGRWLIGPGGIRCTPETLRRAWDAWVKSGLAG